MSAERVNRKLAEWRARLAAFGRAHPPQLVKPKRTSGPRIVPEDWHEPEPNARLPRADDLPPAA